MKSRKPTRSQIEVGLIASLIAVGVVGILLTIGPVLTAALPRLLSLVP
jgi:Flp pilus assembly pilin Flp